MSRFEDLIVEQFTIHGVPYTEEHPEMNAMHHALTQHGYTHRSTEIHSNQKVYTHPHKATVVINHHNNVPHAHFISANAGHELSKPHTTGSSLHNALASNHQHDQSSTYHKDYHRSVGNTYGSRFQH